MPITCSTIFHRDLHSHTPLFPKMMNILALALILTSISNRQIVRESHRLIVLEFERQIPQSSSFPSSAGEIAGEAEKKPLDSGQDLSHPPKAKISSLFTDAKQKTTQLEEAVSNTAKSAAEKLKHKASQIDETIKSSTEEAKQKATQIEESASVAFKTAADSAILASEEVAGNISAFAAKTADLAAESTEDIGRRAWELGRDLAAFVSASVVDAARSAAAVIHLLGFATAYGTCVWVTFVSNHVLASAMPRQQFGILQSRIYPVYFRFLGVAVGVALAGHVLKGKGRVQGYNLMAMLAIVLLNVLWLERKATKAMFEWMKLEKEEGRGREVGDVGTEPAMMPGAQSTATTTPLADALTVKKRLKSLNYYSSLLNVLTLMGLSWHLVSLA